MKEELIRLLLQCTYDELIELTSRNTEASVRTHNTARAIRAMINGKPNQFLQYIALETDNKNSKHQISIKDIGENKFELVYDGVQTELGDVLRERLNYYQEMVTDDFFQIGYELDTPVIDVVAMSLLKNMHIPNVLAKVLAILDTVSSDNIVEVQQFQKQGE